MSFRNQVEQSGYKTRGIWECKRNAFGPEGGTCWCCSGTELAPTEYFSLLEEEGNLSPWWVSYRKHITRHIQNAKTPSESTKSKIFVHDYWKRAVEAPGVKNLVHIPVLVNLLRELEEKEVCWNDVALAQEEATWERNARQSHTGSQGEEIASILAGFGTAFAILWFWGLL